MLPNGEWNEVSRIQAKASHPTSSPDHGAVDLGAELRSDQLELGQDQGVDDQARHDPRQREDQSTRAVPPIGRWSWVGVPVRNPYEMVVRRRARRRDWRRRWSD